MIEFDIAELMGLLRQDVPFLDNTTFGLGISGSGWAKFYPKKDSIILCGISESKQITLECGLNIESCAENGANLGAKELALHLSGDLRAILKISKTLQNLMEYGSSVATYTHKMKSIAMQFNPEIAILGTRKTMPFAKKFLLKALITGGGIPHRLGLSDSVLIFSEHLNALNDAKKSIKQLKSTFKEHRVIIEVDSIESALKMANLGADVLQCERFELPQLSQLVRIIRADFPHILVSATGGINLQNIAEYAKTGVDMVVTTSMYRAEILDIKVEISKILTP
ncbi:ModD protein [Helicobacter sp. 16-1353]|uniref:ModD protein n=1 Tax=Helicobacter sp. 16-1353 TaxID=2004996 RepID=UPI000DCDE74A|nr:ModD protein [Helicobacter sp. 16-1353]RAX52448.1 ModD protein [Helicobacter sp. 16-1353]